jgi:eukaryotic-like serine/threonine-protein kinase
MSVSRGDRLSPYEILARIGEGGMGEVWKARDTRLGRTVAIKTSKTAFSERFEREARATAALNHPHICTLHDVGPDYLVMELVEGAPLRGRSPSRKRASTPARFSMRSMPLTAPASSTATSSPTTSW